MRSSCALFAVFALLAAALPAAGEVYLSREEALELAFPDADRVERRNLVLDAAQTRAIEARAKAPVSSRIVTLYVGHRAGEVLGYALIDIHTVRTLPEAFLVVLTPDGAVRSLRLLAFHEPPEYRPPERWLAQFDQRKLDGELRLRRGIHGIAGSTLSAQAVTRSVRRALALWSVMVDEGSRSVATSEPVSPSAPAAGGAPAGR